MAVIVKRKRLRNIINSIREVGLVDLSKQDQDLVFLILNAKLNGQDVIIKGDD